jgi:hypothetical protein
MGVNLKLSIVVYEQWARRKKIPFQNVCIHIVLYVFLDAATLTEVFPRFFLGCKAKLAKTGHAPHSCKFVVLFYVLFVLYRSTYCLCVNVYCTAATV